MTPERWHRITTIFHAALARDSDARGAFVAEACGDDSTLRHEVESMITAHRRAGTFGEVPTQSPLTLEPGARFGPYVIERRLDGGGMGEVYKARDTRLGRTVALKVVTPALAGDASFQSRFEREARVISQLDHHHICALYDVGTQDGRSYLVMQYLEGESLAQRLERGAMPVDAALRAAVEVADALDGAHSHGVVHRDLKPANVFLTKSGVKLVDFGLAKSNALVSGAPESTAANSVVTTPGMVLGTVPYMAPEQLQGKEADTRTDLFALGAVIFEMITGRMAFGADSQAAVISAIMSADPPPVSTLRGEVPPALDRIVSTCLAKDPEARWQTARDVKRALSWLLEPATGSGGLVLAPRRSRRRLAIFAATLVATAALSGFVVSMRARSGAPQPVPRRLMIDAAPAVAGTIFSPVMAPDGRAVVFHSSRESTGDLMLHRLDTGENRSLGPLPGMDSGWGGQWSADSRSFLFYSSGLLHVFDVTTGARRQLLDAPLSGSTLHAGVAQNAVRTLLFGGTRLQKLDPGEIAPRAVYSVDATVLGQYWPSFLPNGRDFLFAQASTDNQQAGVFLGSLDSDQVTRVVPEFSNAQISPSGHLVFGQGGSLVAQRFDLSTRAVAGGAMVIAADVAQHDGYAQFSLSGDEALAYVPTQRNPMPGELVWYDRDGRPAAKVGPAAGYRQVVITADGRRAAVEIRDDGTDGVWVLDTTRGTMVAVNPPPASRSSFRGMNDPIFSPDGRRLAFTAWVENEADLFLLNATATEPVRLPLPHAQWAESFSPDGRLLLYAETEPGGQLSLRAVPTDGSGPPRVLVSARGWNDEPHVSPDGEWLAYTSNASGRFEVYLQRLGAPSERWRLSVDGGGQPKWRADGRELYFLASDGTLMRVAVSAGRDPGKAQALFRTPLEPTAYTDQYAVSGDGSRFLLIVPVPSRETARLKVLTNWTALLRDPR